MASLQDQRRAGALRPSRRCRVGAAAFALVVAATAAAAAEPEPQRQDKLLYQLRQDCGSCHGLTLKGGLGPSLLPAALGDKSDEALIEIILDGVPGTPMPPWAFEISRDEVSWLVGRLKEGLSDAP